MGLLLRQIAAFGSLTKEVIMIPDLNTARRLLEEGWQRNPGPWKNHSLTAAHCAKTIAERLKMRGNNIDPEKAFYQELERWRVETVVSFGGKVIARSESTVNPKLATGEIEIAAEDIASGRFRLGVLIRDSISGIGSLSVTLYDPQDAEREFDVYSGTGKIWLNGRIVRLEYFGNGTAEALSRELANLLRGESGVAN